MNPKAEKKILIIDGNSFFYRAYYGSIYLTKKKFNYYNAVLTSIRMLKKFIFNQEIYQRIFFTFDHGKKTFRHQMLATYKSHRKKTPDELFVQMKVFKEFLKINQIDFLEMQEFEADDLIASLAEKSLTKKYSVDVISSDHDLLQIIKPHTRLFILRTGVSKMTIVNNTNFQTLFHLTPQQIIDFKSLKGDAGDNLKGVRGVGPKTALNLLQKYDNLENIYQHLNELSLGLKTKLITDKLQAFSTRKMIIIKNDIPLDVDFTLQNYNFLSLNNKNFYIKYKMFALLNDSIKKRKQKAFKFK